MDSSRDIVRKLRENRILNERKEYENMDIKEIVQLAKEGDQLAYTSIINRYGDLIYKMTKKYVPEDTFDVDDIQQTAQIGLVAAIDSWDMKGTADNFEQFAGMIIKRKLIDEYSKLNTEKSKFNQNTDYLDAPKGSDDEGGETTIGASLPSKSLSPEEEYLGAEGARKILEFIEKELSDTERNIIKRYIKGYKVSEISEETGMKYKSVENALKRVKDKLAEYLRHVREAKKIKERDSLFSDEELQILSSIMSKIDERKSVSIEESGEVPHTFQDSQYSIETYNDIEVYKSGKKVAGPFSDMKDAEEWIEDHTMKESQMIHIIVPDDLVGKDTKFRVKYSTAPGQTTEETIDATDEENAAKIIQSRAKRRGERAKIISITSTDTAMKESIKAAFSRSRLKESTNDLNYDDLRYANTVYIGGKLAKEFGDDPNAEEEIKKALDQIITDEYRSINITDDDATIAKKIADAKKEAFEFAMKKIEWDKETQEDDVVMQGHKYLVGGSTPNVTDTGTDYTVHNGGYFEDPKEAIISWLKLSKEAPTSVSIDTNKNAYADELLQWVVDNEEEFLELCKKYHCPYKREYLVAECKKGNHHNFDKDKYHYPDQIYPFALG